MIFTERYPLNVRYRATQSLCWVIQGIISLVGSICLSLISKEGLSHFECNTLQNHFLWPLYERGLHEWRWCNDVWRAHSRTRSVANTGQGTGGGRCYQLCLRYLVARGAVVAVVHTTSLRTIAGRTRALSSTPNSSAQGWVISVTKAHHFRRGVLI